MYRVTNFSEVEAFCWNKPELLQQAQKAKTEGKDVHVILSDVNDPEDFSALVIDGREVRRTKGY